MAEANLDGNGELLILCTLTEWIYYVFFCSLYIGYLSIFGVFNYILFFLL